MTTRPIRSRSTSPRKPMTNTSPTRRAVLGRCELSEDDEVHPFTADTLSAQHIREKTTLTVRVQHLQALLLESQSVIAEQQEVIRSYEANFGEVRDVLRGTGLPVSLAKSTSLTSLATFPPPSRPATTEPIRQLEIESNAQQQVHLLQSTIQDLRQELNHYISICHKLSGENLDLKTKLKTVILQYQKLKQHYQQQQQQQQQTATFQDISVKTQLPPKSTNTSASSLPDITAKKMYLSKMLAQVDKLASELALKAELMGVSRAGSPESKMGEIKIEDEENVGVARFNRNPNVEEDDERTPVQADFIVKPTASPPSKKKPSKDRKSQLKQADQVLQKVFKSSSKEFVVERSRDSSTVNAKHPNWLDLEPEFKLSGEKLNLLLRKESLTDIHTT